jgi:hypothetical protein
MKRNSSYEFANSGCVQIVPRSIPSRVTSTLVLLRVVNTLPLYTVLLHRQCLSELLHALDESYVIQADIYICICVCIWNVTSSFPTVTIFVIADFRPNFMCNLYIDLLHLLSISARFEVPSCSGSLVIAVKIDSCSRCHIFLSSVTVDVKFQDHILSGDCIAPISQVRASDMLLPTVATIKRRSSVVRQ